MSSETLAKVFIVGGGFAGVSAAKALAHAPAKVTLVDRRNHHVFQPQLYQVATASLSPADISAPIRTVVIKRIARLYLAKLPESKHLEFAIGCVRYDATKATT